MTLLTLSASKPVVFAGQEVVFTAHLTDDYNNPVLGAPTTLYRDAVQGETVDTNANGDAAFSVLVDGQAGQVYYFVAIALSEGHFTQSNQLSVTLKGEDPRETLKAILATVQLYDDNYANPAKVHVADSFEQTMMKDFDVIVWLELLEEADHSVDRSGNRRIMTKWYIGITVQDHAGFSVNRALWDAESEIKKAIGAKVDAPGGILKHIYPVGMTPRIYDRSVVPPIVTEKYQILTERIVLKGGP